LLESHFLTKDREGATTPRRKRAEPQEFNVRLKMTGEMARRFNAIKQKHQFKQNAGLVRLLINDAYEKIAADHPLTHFNTYEDHITIRDNRIGRYIDIWPRDGKLWCEYCEKTRCRHITFVKNLPLIMETLEKKGWKPG